jgi:hypothetical protein
MTTIMVRIRVPLTFIIFSKLYNKYDSCIVYCSGIVNLVIQTGDPSYL